MTRKSQPTPGHRLRRLCSRLSRSKAIAVSTQVVLIELDETVSCGRVNLR